MPSRLSTPLRTLKSRFITIIIVSSLVFGAIGFIYTVFSEAYITNRYGEPQTPYGAPAMLSIFTCAVLGGIAGASVDTFRFRSRSFLILLLGNLAIFIFYIQAWYTWTGGKWDASSAIVFPSVFGAAGLCFLIIVTSVLYRRLCHRIG